MENNLEKENTSGLHENIFFLFGSILITTSIQVLAYFFLAHKIKNYTTYMPMILLEMIVILGFVFYKIAKRQQEKIDLENFISIINSVLYTSNFLFTLVAVYLSRNIYLFN